MDIVSDERIDKLIEWLSEPVEEGVDLREALTELRDRRKAEKKDATDHDHECPYCGDYHDNRIACIAYSDRQAEKTIDKSGA